MPNIDHQQWAAYLASLSSDLLAPPASVLVASLLRFTGADIGEILGLTRINGERLSGIRQSDLIADSAMPQLKFKRQKVDTSPSRDVPCPQFLFNDLLAHVAASNIRAGEEIFGMTRRSEFESAHRRARRVAGLHDTRIKDFRHVAAITWVKAGVPLTRVRTWLGHSSIQQTAVYADFVADPEWEMPLVEKAARMAQGQL